MTSPFDDTLTEKLSEARDAARDMHKTLRMAGGDPKMQGLSIWAETAHKILSIETDEPSAALADHLTSLESQLRRTGLRLDKRNNFEAEVSVHRGHAIGAIANAIEFAKDAGYRPSQLENPMLERNDIAAGSIRTLLSGLEKRLRNLERQLDAVLEQTKDPKATPQQIGLLNVFVAEMKPEIALARVEISAETKVDLSGLERAVLRMTELTASFVATVGAIGSLVSKSVSSATAAIATNSKKVVSGFRAIVRRVMTKKEKKGVEPVPKALGPPPSDFDVAKVRAMVLSGKTPPQMWTPWIKELSFRETKLQNLKPIAGLTALTRLNLAETKVSELTALSRLTVLQYLDLRETGVEDVAALSELTALQSLNLGGSNVRNISALSRLTSLQSLDLRITAVADVSPLAELQELQILVLWGTKVSDVSSLSGLLKLKWLDLAGTYVGDVSVFSGLNTLEWLDLRGTKVQSLSALAKLENLSEVYVDKSVRDAITKTHPRGREIVRVRGE